MSFTYVVTKMKLTSRWIALTAPLLAAAQFPPEPEGMTIIRSRFNDSITISYKETDICETTPGVRGFSGYVHLPPGALEDLGEHTNYSINTFFWFFEARHEPANAPLSIWLNGGPGASSMLGLLAEHGPCWVEPDSNSTRLNEWSWNDHVNMLYLDQPVGAGFSYNSLVNITTNLVTNNISVLRPSDPVPPQNATFLVGTDSSQDSSLTSRGSRNAAIALWHFAQVWFQEFPEYHPNDSRISLATESYGGRFGPAFVSFFEEQNQRIENQSFTGAPGTSYVLQLDTLFLINSCIDRLVQWPSYPQQAFNNTYGIQAVNQSVYEGMIDSLYKPGGCNDQIYECRNLSLAYDPDNLGINMTVNKVCSEAETYCVANVRSPYQNYSGRNYYDIGVLDPDPWPSPFYFGYLNQPHVQSALGVPLNWSIDAIQVARAFRRIGDYNRPGWLEDLAYLLESGIKVHMAYGDRDYACNWIGGEAVSLAINYTNSSNFRAAGYTPITTNASYSGGMVRQYGNLSFSRVFEAGHEVPFYQPETAYRIFNRALFNLDIATGTLPTIGSDGNVYSTTGLMDTWATKNKVPEQPLQYCYVLDPKEFCTNDQIKSIENGTAVICDYILVDRNSTQLFPEIVGACNRTGTNSSVAGSGVSPVAFTAGVGSLAKEQSMWVMGWAALFAGALL
ncbi:carboxypeptidase S1-like protein B [Teratosphaeria nubilosa]|uniref:Carboxypeptidase S1-like protein B n=1 Tax=Teratosphaeria nubilosa TaxID=161662 RepID=A0A6G1L406_9PEZI|nr:carboxypeptidase S1-like protein B [Teratosphaeria nubilosa]